MSSISGDFLVVSVGVFGCSSGLPAMTNIRVPDLEIHFKGKTRDPCHVPSRYYYKAKAEDQQTY
jgi:hypothetical protein